MKTKLRFALASLCLMAFFATYVSAALAADEQAFARETTWSLVSATDARQQVAAFLQQQGLDEAARSEALRHWPAEEQFTGQEILDHTIIALSACEPRLQEVRAWCSAEPAALGLPPFDFLKDEAVPEFVRNQGRLFLARACVQRDLADECLELLTGLTTDKVVDPAGLLFQSAVAHHRLLQKEDCLREVTQLLEREKEIPARYVRLSHLMADDIRPLKKDSLDEVSRMMEDVRRRLDQARAGTKVRNEEEEIIAKLDKMIDDLEEQQKQQQQQQQSSGQAKGKSPSSPAQDSSLPELKGPGEVDLKNIGKKSGWGNLPPKERQEVLQQIGKELPAHFRETIEEYFQRLAQDGVK